MGDTGTSKATHEHADKDGHFRRKDSSFRDWISKDQDSKFPAEKGRYVLYCNLGCPWAHRTILVRVLKNLEDIIQVVYTDFDLTENGWLFTGRNESADRDPLYGFLGLKQLYMKADPDYTGRYTVPCLWDRKTETVVNNESSEIIRMFYTEFDELIAPEFREANKNSKGIYPVHLRSEIDEMNDWVYNTVNNGVYKCGFARNQEAYDANVYPLFESLDRLESHLSNPEACHGGPFLFGAHITEADIRLFTTLIRFDSAYHTIFMCNLKSIRHDYPRLSRWLRRLYWNTSNIPKGKVFRDTTRPEIYRYGYTQARTRQILGAATSNTNSGPTANTGNNNYAAVIPGGPLTTIDPWTEDDASIDNGRLIALKTLLEKNGTDTSGTATPTGPSSTTTDFANLSINTKEYKPSANGKVDLTAESRSPRTASSNMPNMGSFVTTGEGVEAGGDIDPARKLTKKATTTYEDQNSRWYKAAKKAEKKVGAPNVHLAL